MKFNYQSNTILIDEFRKIAGYKKLIKIII
jgi:hypothetical protein